MLSSDVASEFVCVNGDLIEYSLVHIFGCTLYMKFFPKQKMKLKRSCSADESRSKH